MNNSTQKDGYNHIAKRDALSWLQDNRKKFTPDYNAALIYQVTVLGNDYDELRESMSYLCRAYSITKYGGYKTSNTNRILNRYRNYIDRYTESDIRKAIREIVLEHPNGMEEEHPAFDNLLEAKLSQETKDAYLPRPIPDNESSFVTSENHSSHTMSDLRDKSKAFFGKFSDKNPLVVLGIIAVAVLLVYLFRKQIFSLIGSIIPYLLGALIIYLIYKIIRKKSAKNNAKATYQSPSYSTAGQKNRSSSGFGISFGRLIGALAWAGIFLYAAFYYRSAGSPILWTIIAAAIGVIGGVTIAKK